MQTVQLPISPVAEIEEFEGMSLLGYAPFLDNHDPICMGNGGETVCHDERRAPFR